MFDTEHLPISADILDVVIKNAKRAQTYSENAKSEAELKTTLKYSAETTEWLNAAKSLLRCRRALMTGNMELLLSELRSHGYLGRFRKMNAMQRPCSAGGNRLMPVCC